MLFKTPMQGDARLALSALFSGKVETPDPDGFASDRRRNGADLAHADLEPLAGQNVLIDGLQNTMTDALVRVHSPTATHGPRG